MEFFCMCNVFKNRTWQAMSGMSICLRLRYEVVRYAWWIDLLLPGQHFSLWKWISVRRRVNTMRSISTTVHSGHVLHYCVLIDNALQVIRKYAASGFITRYKIRRRLVPTPSRQACRLGYLIVLLRITGASVGRCEIHQTGSLRYCYCCDRPVSRAC